MTATDPSQTAVTAPVDTAQIKDLAAADAWGSAPDAAPAEPVPDLAALLATAQAQADQHRQDYLRALADNENQRKRAQRELDQARQYALERFAQALLPVSDALELAIAAGHEPNANVTQLREGDALTLKLFGGVLEQFGVVGVDPLNQRFNPEQHEAMGMETVAGAAPNSVVKVYQKGYLLNGRLLRPARVVIAKSAPSA